MKPDLFTLEWLVADSLQSVEHHVDGDLWSLYFVSGASISIECMWRLLKAGILSSTSFDHGQRFGLPAPFDAVEALQALRGHPVTFVRVCSGTNDLVLQFGQEFTLEVLAMSGGYEAWAARSPNVGEVFACAGGELSGVRAQQAVQGPTSPPSAGPRP